MTKRNACKVALVARADQDLAGIRGELKKSAQLDVKEFLSLDEINSRIKSFSFEVLLMHIPFFASAHVQMLARVRQRFPGAGLVSLASEIDPAARFQARQIPRHKLIHEPIEIKDLSTVIEMVREDDVSALRLHARTRREGEAEIVQATGRRIKARFLDFAQMGARLSIHTRQPLQKNDRLQLHYQSASEPGRIHRIESVVVWQDTGGGLVESLVSGPQQTVGLRFIAAL